MINPAQKLRKNPEQGMSFRQKLVHRRKIAIRDTIIDTLFSGVFSYMATTHSLWYVVAIVAFGVAALLSVIDVVRKTRGIKTYDSRPELAYLVEIRNMFGITS